MKPGSRVLGIAESYTDDTSVLVGVVMTGHGRIDDFVVGTIAVGGCDVTQTILEMVDRLGREDVRHLLVSGVALAWFNILDVHQVAETVDRPVVAVTFEASEGLQEAINAEFDEPAANDRLRRYQQLPPRRELSIHNTTMFVRTAGCSTDTARSLLEQHTPATATRPEPLRIANRIARAIDDARNANAI